MHCGKQKINSFQPYPGRSSGTLQTPAGSPPSTGREGKGGDTHPCRGYCVTQMQRMKKCPLIMLGNCCIKGVKFVSLEEIRESRENDSTISCTQKISVADSILHNRWEVFRRRWFGGVCFLGWGRSWGGTSTSFRRVWTGVVEGALSRLFREFRVWLRQFFWCCCRTINHPVMNRPT